MSDNDKKAKKGKLPAPAPVPDSELRGVAHMTALMRAKEAEISDLAAKRRDLFLMFTKGSPERKKVSYARLAAACGISDVAVYKALRNGGPGLREMAAKETRKTID